VRASTAPLSRGWVLMAKFGSVRIIVTLAHTGHVTAAELETATQLTQLRAQMRICARISFFKPVDYQQQER